MKGQKTTPLLCAIALSETKSIIRRALALFAMATLAVAASAQDLPTFEIVMKDGNFSPERLEVPAGKRLKLVLKMKAAVPPNSRTWACVSKRCSRRA